jgi:hypothetical protein
MNKLYEKHLFNICLIDDLSKIILNELSEKINVDFSSTVSIKEFEKMLRDKNAEFFNQFDFFFFDATYELKTNFPKEKLDILGYLNYYNAYELYKKFLPTDYGINDNQVALLMGEDVLGNINGYGTVIDNKKNICIAKEKGILIYKGKVDTIINFITKNAHLVDKEVVHYKGRSEYLDESLVEKLTCFRDLLFTMNENSTYAIDYLNNMNELKELAPNNSRFYTLFNYMFEVGKILNKNSHYYGQIALSLNSLIRANTKNQKKIFIICSKAFYHFIDPIKEQLEEMGYEVFLPNCYDKPETEGLYRGTEEHAKFKAEMYAQSENIIKKVDAVLVLNYNKYGEANYIGGATFLEIYDAFRMNKLIYFMNDIPKGILEDELIGFSPIILNEDLSKINEDSSKTKVLK